MCVIAYKAKDVRFPSEGNIRKMWEHNPDGAGVMWRDPQTNEIRFVKGFMKLKNLEKWIDANRNWLKDVECALHFRITTHGGTSPGNCHPFTVAADANPHTQEGVAPRVLMHNGMLSVVPRQKDISDSAELALRLGEMGNPKGAMDALNEQLSGNRIILMDENGTHFYGDDFKKSDDAENAGLLYSNLHFEVTRSFFTSAGGGYLDGYGGYGGCYGRSSLTETTPSPGYYGSHYDSILDAFVDDLTGEMLDLKDVDPDFLSAEEAKIWEDMVNGEHWNDAQQANRFGLTMQDYRDAKTEADSFGMDVGEYITDVYGDPEEAEVSRACG